MSVVEELPENAVCLCACERKHHRLGRKGCKSIGCGCDRFEADAAMADVPSDPTESTSAALARVTAERDYALNLAEALRRTIAELADERDHARSERDALKALYADAVKRLNTQP